MLDIIAAIAGAAVYTILTVILVSFSQTSRRSKIVAFAAAAFWGVLIVLLSVLGFFKDGASGIIPGPVIAFSTLLLILLGSYFLSPRFRKALLEIPLPALIAANVARLGGVSFLILHTHGRLSAPFAPVAGWGDIFIAALAIPVAWLAMKSAAGRRVVSVWNFFGALDLILAVTLALLSSPTPFRVFTAEPGTLAMSELPWAMIPTMMVPLFLLIHTIIAAKLRLLKRSRNKTLLLGRPAQAQAH